MQGETLSPFGVDQVLVQFNGDSNLRATVNDVPYLFSNSLDGRQKRVPWQAAVLLVQQHQTTLSINHPEATTILAELDTNANKGRETPRRAKTELLSTPEPGIEKSKKNEVEKPKKNEG